MLPSARRPLPQAALLLSLALLPMSCAGPGAEDAPALLHLSARDMADYIRTGAAGKRGGAVIRATFVDPKTFNMLIAKETSSTDAVGIMFNGLIRRNPETLQFEPDLARSWTRSPDGLTWIFNLRRGIRWSDGQPFTADDFLFTLDAIYDIRVDTSLREDLLVDRKPWKYRKLDEYRVRIDLPSRFAPFLDMVSIISILPRHKLQAAQRAGKFNPAWGIDTPPSEIVGTGPFRMVKYVPGEKLLYRRNPYYWRLAKDARPFPFLRGAVTEIVPDLNTGILKFDSGEVDFTILRPEDWAERKKREPGSDYRLRNLGPDWGITYLAFNQNPRAARLASYKRAWFSNKTFRQAVSYAIDRNALAQTVYRGLGQPLWSPVTAANKLYYDPGVRQYPFDPARARRLLAGMGLIDRNGDGVLQDAQGHPVEFDLITNTGNNVRIAICSMIQENLKNVGIKVNVAPLEFNALVTRLDHTYDWEAEVLGFTGGPEPYSAKVIWESRGMLHVWNPRQSSPATPWEAEIDRIFEDSSRTLEPAKRKALFDRWQEIIAEEQPLIFLVNGDVLMGARRKIHNLRPTSLSPTWPFYEWTVE